MNMTKFISATAATVLTAVSCLAIAQPVPTYPTAIATAATPAERSAATASPRAASKPVSDTIVVTAPHLRTVQVGMLDTSTTRAMERIAPTRGNTMSS